jgi:hypothetical protein
MPVNHGSNQGAMVEQQCAERVTVAGLSGGYKVFGGHTVRLDGGMKENIKAAFFLV